MRARVSDTQSLIALRTAPSVRQSVAEAILLVAVLAQLAEEAGGGALRGGGGVVELVREIGGEFAEGGELFRLLLHARDLADAVEQDGDAALRHGGDGGEHLGKERLVDVERPRRGRRRSRRRRSSSCARREACRSSGRRGR